MPKIIKNLDQKILSSARTLFEVQGYDQTDMRQIAEKAQIAVGTLYRYFRDKEDLYIHVLVDSWKKTRDNLKTLSAGNQDPTDIFQQMISTLIQDLQTNRPFNQLWREVAKMHVETTAETRQNYRFEGMHHKFSTLFSQVLVKMLTFDPNEQDLADLKRLGSFAFVMVVDSCMIPPEGLERQVAFITGIFVTYIHRCNQLGSILAPV